MSKREEIIRWICLAGMVLIAVTTGTLSFQGKDPFGPVRTIWQPRPAFTSSTDPEDYIIVSTAIEEPTPRRQPRKATLAELPDNSFAD